MNTKLTLDGREVLFTQGQTILDVARSQGVRIPTLCHLEEVNPTGLCRICVVEVEGEDQLLPACATPAGEGMNIHTASERVMASRRTNLGLIMATGYHSCPSCEAAGDCRLQDLAYEFQLEEIHYPRKKADFPVQDQKPLIYRDFSKCILCGRCVAACNEVQVNQAIPYPFGRREDHGGPEGWYPLTDTDKCVRCGECVQACPVGALLEGKARGKGRTWEMTRVRATCPYGGVGCRVVLNLKDGRLVKVDGDQEAAPNRGRLCVMGRFLCDFVDSKDRLDTPLIREDGELREASWDEALDLVAAKFKEIIDSDGPDAIGGIAPAGTSNEDAFQMQKLFRTAIGTNNIDSARRSHAPAVEAMSEVFGLGAAPSALADIEQAALILVVGPGARESHPVAASFIKQAARAGAGLIVAEPAGGTLTEFAELHLPVREGDEAALLNVLMRIIIDQGLYDKAFVQDKTTGFDALKDSLAAFAPDRLARRFGVDEAVLEQAARRLAEAKPALVVYGAGKSEPAQIRLATLACANLQLLLGNMGQAGGGLALLSGSSNAQGACDMGALPGLLPGGGAVDDAEARAAFEKAWQCKLPAKAGLDTTAMAAALAEGRLKALYVSGENLAARTRPDAEHMSACLQKGAFVIVQGVLANETTKLAHVVLPATAWCEDAGTTTSAERRVSLTPKALEAPGEAKAAWWIYKEIAARLGQTWSEDSAREVWEEGVLPLVPALAGIQYERLSGDGLQWPAPDAASAGTVRLYENGAFTQGKAAFTPAE